MEETKNRLTIIGIYPWWGFWSMGEGKGSPSFYLSPRSFVEAGHRMVLVMLRGDNPPGISDYDGIELVRYGGGPATILENPSRGRFVRFFIRNFRFWQYTIASFVAGYRTCCRVRPDALIGYGDHAALSTWCLGKIFRVPCITRLFGTILARYLGNHLKLYYHYIQVLPFKLPGRYVVMVDDGSRGDQVARVLGVPASRFRLWRNGIDHGMYEPEADSGALRAGIGLPSRVPLLFTISRLHPEKHIERILAALPVVRQHHPRVGLVVIGEGGERAFLEAEAARLGVGGAVIWTGGVTQEQLGRYIMACDIFVAMSDRTNAANPLFEAMICARPCVVLDTGATSSVIRDGENGWLVPEERPEELGPTLLKVLADLSRAREVGLRGREWAAANIPTWKERQRMEVEILERAVAEFRSDHED